MLKKILTLLLILIIIPILYIIGVLTWGTIGNYKPEAKIILKSKQAFPATKVIKDTTLSAMIWNIGYGGLGAEMDFFYDNGNFFFSNNQNVLPSSDLYEKYFSEILNYIQQNNDHDFYLFQELDRDSKRSFGQNQYESISTVLNNYEYVEATNYKTPFVPIPFLEPWNAYGRTHAGLGTFAKYSSLKSIRYQLPGDYKWPNDLFLLDRCISVQQYQTTLEKDLIVINLHNSAYDDGSLKKQQVAFIKKIAEQEYAKGNYVVLGGDWNQCPPNFDLSDYVDKQHVGLHQSEVPKDLFGLGWKWNYDKKHPTNRKCYEIYKKGKTKVSTIDFFVTSPNISVLKVETQRLNFQFSDHEPVIMTFRLHD